MEQKLNEALAKDAERKRDGATRLALLRGDAAKLRDTQTRIMPYHEVR